MFIKYNCKFVILITFLIQITKINSTSIVIIGAGISGLASAKVLLKNGFNEVTILEAENRIGGRINSVYFGDNYFDLGATFCHGEKGNIVYSMVKNLNLLRSFRFPIKFYHSSGIEFDEKLAEEISDTMRNIYMDINKPNTNQSYGEYITEKFNEDIIKKYGTEKRKLQIAQDVLGYIELGVLSNEGSPTWFDGTINDDYVENEGDRVLIWKGTGYKAFIDVFLDKYNDTKKISDVEKKVTFNKEVTKISYDIDKKEQGVTVTCSDNSQYVADHVIVTTSLGVLKSKFNTLFYPELPLKKINSINNIGFGAIMKVAMHYKEPWWNPDWRGFNILWSKEEMENSISLFPSGPHHENRSWITSH